MPFLDILFTSVVVDDFHVRRTIVGPPEANPELVVDPDTVLSFPITLQRLQPIARRRSQELQGVRSIKHREFTRRVSTQRKLLITRPSYND